MGAKHGSEKARSRGTFAHDGFLDKRHAMPIVISLEDAEGLRCVDIVERDNGTFIIKECRRDPEARRWSVVGDYSSLVFATKAQAIEAARAAFPWLIGISR